MRCFSRDRLFKNGVYLSMHETHAQGAGDIFRRGRAHPESICTCRIAHDSVIRSAQ